MQANFEGNCCCFVEQGGHEELVGCNYFQWCIEQGIEEKLGLMNKEKDESLVKMEERDGERVKTEKLEKFVFMLEKWFKLLILDDVCFVRN